MRRWLLAVALAFAAVAVHPVESHGLDAKQSEPPADDQRQPPAREPGPKKPPADDDTRSRISLEDATAIVRQAYGGRVVSAASAEARPAAKRPKERGHRVRVDVDGRVKTVFVDGRGRIHENAEF